MGIEFLVLPLLALAAILSSSGILATCSVVCAPNQVQVIKGRGDNRGRDYGLLVNGQTMRIPLVETVRALDTTLLQVDVELDDVVCADRAMVELRLDAFMTLSRFEPGGHAAIEGFLGSSRQRSSTPDGVEDLVQTFLGSPRNKMVDAAEKIIRAGIYELAAVVDAAEFTRVLDRVSERISETLNYEF